VTTPSRKNVAPLQEGAGSLIDPQTLMSIKNLELRARVVVEGFWHGFHRSPYHGFSVEFAEHRLYNEGQSTRHIDWKVFARTDRLYVKKFEEETNLRCMIVMDASSSMFFPEKEESKSGLRKIDFAAIASASVMQLLRKQRDAFGLTIFSGASESMSEVKSSSVHHKVLLGQLESLLGKSERNKKTAAAATSHASLSHSASPHRERPTPPNNHCC